MKMSHVLYRQIVEEYKEITDRVKQGEVHTIPTDFGGFKGHYKDDVESGTYDALVSSESLEGSSYKIFEESGTINNKHFGDYVKAAFKVAFCSVYLNRSPLQFLHSILCLGKGSLTEGVERLSLPYFERWANEYQTQSWRDEHMKNSEGE